MTTYALTDDPSARSLMLLAKQRARQQLYDGQPTAANLELARFCTHQHRPSGSQMIYTRDADAHLSGWWKNPDYARCLHLSLSYRNVRDRSAYGREMPHDHRLSEQWCRLFFGQHVRWLWCEPPYTEVGKQFDTWHYRLFMTPGWLSPLKPRGEVYSRDNTPARWMSWSDVQEQRAKLGQVAPAW
mgnify:FL=1